MIFFTQLPEPKTGAERCLLGVLGAHIIIRSYQFQIGGHSLGKLRGLVFLTSVFHSGRGRKKLDYMDESAPRSLVDESIL
jgi:hypothetical protein